jgi:hypothetical protein
MQSPKTKKWLINLSCIILLIGLLSCKKNQPVAEVKAPEPITGIAVPLAGNAYITKGVSGGTESINESGLTNWTSADAVCSGYFKVEQSGELQVALRLKVSGTSKLKVSINGTPFELTVTNSGYDNIAAGKVTLTKAGYVKVDLQGISKTGAAFAEVSDLIVYGPVSFAGVKFANDPANFYWSRRGPSVHLGYTAPAGTNTEWFYNEMTVPVGEDNIGSYFMSNGFGEGYFGIQVNSTTERRVLFSVWDPAVGKTTLVKKGANVVTNTFGGEGTGGQSYLLYNWSPGVTYKFLTQGKPDGNGNTIYSSWFYATEQSQWLFIATWLRPNTSKYLTGLHSFLENFIDRNGWMGRKVYYDHQWARSSDGNWAELTTARFTGDATASNQQRFDYAGGAENDRFYLRMGGYFDNPVATNQQFNRPAKSITPVIDLSLLP